MRTIFLKRALLASVLAGVCLSGAMTCNVPGLDGWYYGSYGGYYEDVWYEETYYQDDYYYEDYYDDGWGLDLWFDDWW